MNVWNLRIHFNVFLLDLPLYYLGTLQAALLYYELVKAPIKCFVVSHTSVGHISLPGVVFHGTTARGTCCHDNVYLELAWEWFTMVISVCKQRWGNKMKHLVTGLHTHTWKAEGWTTGFSSKFKVSAAFLPQCHNHRRENVSGLSLVRDPRRHSLCTWPRPAKLKAVRTMTVRLCHNFPGTEAFLLNCNSSSSRPVI